MAVREASLDCNTLLYTRTDQCFSYVPARYPPHLCNKAPKCTPPKVPHIAHKTPPLQRRKTSTMSYKVTRLRPKDRNIDEIGVLQWNAGGFPPSREEELFSAMRENNCQIAALEEIKWNDIHKPAPHYDGYEVFYQQHTYTSPSKQRGGAAFIVRNDIVVSQDFSFSSDICVVVIRVHLEGDMTLMIANAYVPPQEYSLIPKLHRLVARLPEYAILCGDFNAHNPMWDSLTPQNTAGRNLVRVLDENPDKLILLNPADIPTHLTSRKSPKGIRESKTVIDLSFCTPRAWEYTTWTLLPASVLSYAPHRPIRLSVSLKALTRDVKSFRPHYKLRGADPETFKVATEKAFEPLVSRFKELPLNEKVKAIQTAFEKVGIEEIGLTSPSSSQRKPEWDASLTQAKRSRNKARRHRQEEPQSEARRRREKQADKKFRNLREKKKQHCDKSRMKNICDFSNDPWAAIHKFTGKLSATAFVPVEGNTSDIDIANFLLGKFATESAPIDEKSQYFCPLFSKEVTTYLDDYESDFKCLDSKEPYNQDFTMQELARVLENIKVTTAPGADNLPPWFYAHCGEHARWCILETHNESFRSGTLPELHKASDLVPIPKPRRDRTLAKSYRPVSLTLVNARVSETMIHKRLYHWAEENKYVPPTQAAFRHHHSTLHPLLRLTQAVHEGFAKNQRTLCVALDLSRAFDKVCPKRMRYRLHKLGLRGRMLAWVSSFMTERRYRVVRPAVTDYTTFGIGVPQGSGLSPLLFIIFIAEISHLLHCDHAEFADDITLWYSSWDDRTTVDMINEDLRTIELWAKKWGMYFGDKNSYYDFYRTRDGMDVEGLGGLQFFSRPIERAKDFCLLGVHLDHGLHFNQHCQAILASGRRRRNILSALLGRRLINNAPALLVAFKGFVRSKIEYASAVYSPIAECHQKELERFQSSCLRLVLGARKNTPAQILNNECSASSLSSRRDDAVLRTYMKILALPITNPLRVSLQKWRQTTRSYELTTIGNTPRSFFFVAERTYMKYFHAPLPRAPAPNMSFPVATPPWNSFYMPPNKVDILKDFRRSLRKKSRVFQMVELNSARSTFWYCQNHPTKRRDWLKCLPLKRVHQKIMVRLRSGYAGIGFFTHSDGAVLPCPKCGGYDSIRHMLLECQAYHAERTILFERVNAATQGRLGVTLPLLLGFHDFLSNATLRSIATSTGQFVLDIGRHI